MNRLATSPSRHGLPGRGACALLGALALSACAPSAAPPPAAGTATPVPGGAPAGVPREMTVVPDDPVEAYAYLRGEGETPLEGGRILRHLESDLNSLNPVLATISYETYCNRYLFDPLVDYDARLEIVPVLAESWTISEDRTTIELPLRKDVRWHDGKPFTASDVCFTLDMVLDDKVPAFNVRPSFVEVASCEAVEPHRVRIRFKRPYAPMLAQLTNLLPIPEHVYRVKDTAQFASQPANRAPVGSGAWRFVSWESQSRVVVRRNDDYWGVKPHPAETIFKVIDNRETALKAAQAGELDEQYVPSTKWFGEVATPAFADFNKTLYYTYSFNYYGLNNNDPLFSDRRVRQAVSLAQNTEAIIRDLYFNLAREISGPFQPDTVWYDSTVEPWPYDLERAAALLAEAGFRDSNGNGTIDRDGLEFKFELLYPSGNTISEQTGAILQQDLRKLGIDMTLRALEGATFFDRVNKGEFSAVTLAWRGDPDPTSFLVLFDSRQAPPNGANHCFYKNPEVDRLIDEQMAEFDPAKRAEIVHRIHRIIRDDAPMVFSLATPMKRIFRNTVRGIHMSTQEVFVVQPGAQQWWLVAGKGPARPM